jgi:ectoine hydroxylase-related dioxygenase (phytanoyl-CoA dioxygenase family)
VTRLIGRDGVIEGVGKAGSMLVFHSNAIHGSDRNRSASPRVIGLLTFNPMTNAPRESSPRPNYFVNSDPEPFSRYAATR